MATKSRNLPRKTQKYERMCERIVDAAADVINDTGLSGMTFASVADRVDLNTTSISYYFKRKEMLAEAAFERAFDQIEEHAADAATGATPRKRVARFLELELLRWAKVRTREQPRRAQLSEVRTMDEPARAKLGKRYVAIMRTIRGFFGPDADPDTKAANIARAHLLIENVFWLPGWIQAYSNWDFDRVHRRMMEMFEGGVAGTGRGCKPMSLEVAPPAGDLDSSAAEAFLQVATRLISERGYRGASVERIAAELEVTKGSFYHHLDAKDDLVMMCFERSYHRLSHIQHAAIALDTDGCHRLASLLDRLLEIQFRDDFPLLRGSALQALPRAMREEAMVRSRRIGRRYADILIDGISDGSIRPLDPLIGSQMIVVAVNAAFELRRWAGSHPGDAKRTYYDLIMRGLFR